ncbi:MAG: polysaccharide deacetylase family protein [bacterium]|jgi:peptidoglycan/xylan/chitin deacetylase (PgdA/CDA1 family)
MSKMFNKRAAVICLALVFIFLFNWPLTGRLGFPELSPPAVPDSDITVPSSKVPPDTGTAMPPGAVGAAVPVENSGGDPAKTIYLTFDDGPSKNTAAVLDILREYGIKATFFVNGRDSEFACEMYRRIVGEGHALGNHTYSHDYSYIYASLDNYLADTEKLADLLEAATGVRPQLIRFPGGSNNQVSWRYGGKQLMIDLAREMTARGYEFFDWNAGGIDAVKGVTARDTIVRTVLKQISRRHETIILLHDGAKQTTTVEALPEIIGTLLADGYEFRPLTPDAYNAHFIDVSLCRAEAGA